MAVEIPVQALFERYKQENAQLTERALIAESAQEILEQQNAQLTQLNQLQGAELETLRLQIQPTAVEGPADGVEGDGPDGKWAPATTA